MLTENSIRQFTDHIASQSHAMAGATIAASAAAACSLGDACLHINVPLVASAADSALAERLAGQLAGIRSRLLALTDEDGAAITAFAALRAATLLLDSNMRLWPEPDLLAKYEPELAALRAEAGRVQPVDRIRPERARP